eukprot:10959276-Alexandrium_andersonii.AAC.1
MRSSLLEGERKICRTPDDWVVGETTGLAQKRVVGRMLFVAMPILNPLHMFWTRGGSSVQATVQ